MRTQLDQERAIMQDTGFWALQKECWTIPGNRKRALLTIGIITFQQWSGVSGSLNNLTCVYLGAPLAGLTDR